MKKLYILVPRVDDQAPIKIARAIAVASVKEFDTTIVPLRRCKFDSIDGIKVKNIGVWFFQIVMNENQVIIHSHGFFPDLFSIVFALSKKIKTISTVHSDIQKEMFGRFGCVFGGLFLFIWMFSLQTKDHVVFLNLKVLKKYNKFILSRCAVVYNGLDFPRYERSTTRRFNNKKKVIGCIGRLVPVKGFEQVIELMGKSDRYNLIVAGDGPVLNDLKLNSLQSKERIEFLGSVSDLSEFYTQIDLIIIPSRSEGFPLVLIESIAQGIPIVTSDIPQFLEFANLINSITFELDNIESLNVAVEKALNHDSKFWASNSSVYKEYFSASRMYERYLELYDHKSH